MAAQSAPEFKRPIAVLENDAASLSRRGSEPASIVYGDLRAAGAPFGWLNTMSVASIDGGSAGGATRRYTHHEAMRLTTTASTRLTNELLFGRACKSLPWYLIHARHGPPSRHPNGERR